MFKIGDFSKICQVSIKALRHWDEVGLLKPAHIDPETRYRYYSIEQLATVNRIQAYRGMGFPLAEISRLLADNLTANEIRALLHDKQEDIRRQIEQSQAMLTLINARLQQIDTEGQRPTVDVVLKSTTVQRAALMRECTPNLKTLVKLLVDAQTVLTQHQAQVPGPLFGIFHNEGYELEQIDFELGFPVNEDTQGRILLAEGRELMIQEMPAVPLLACLIHQGAWNSLSSGYANLGRWLDYNNYQIVGPGREVFHNIGQPPDHLETITEIQFPVAR